MQLYAGMSRHFFHDTVHNQIAGKLSDAFFRHYRYRPSPAEVRSWRESLRAVSQVIEGAGLDDHGVILEYRLPLTSRRLDCLVCGEDAARAHNAVIIELKQWERCRETDAENVVTTWIGGAERDTLHPSAQVAQYQRYLEDTHTAFHEGDEPVALRSCAYLHNYHPEPGDVLFADRYRRALAGAPAFTADHVDRMQRFLGEPLVGGCGHDVLRRIVESKYRPSKKLMEHVGNVIKGLPDYVLLDEQLVVYERVLACARAGWHDRRKVVLIIKGGPGTGKSVIALNLMSDLLLDAYNACYATGSKAFTETLRKLIGARGVPQFKYFNSFMNAEPDSIDVLICDEAHRIRKTSNNRYTKKELRTTTPQIDELLRVAKVGVFFIDDRQLVRPDEIGSAAHIRAAAGAQGCAVLEYELEAQFRCAGSDGFVNWVDNTLGIERTANVIWEGDESFDFRIFSSAEALDAAIRARASAGHSARLTAGFCWPWSRPQPDGTLVLDVEIGDFERAWNARPEARRLAAGVPRAPLWAHDPAGIDQVGCIYTAQGFEFDYVGVIIGKDLRYDWNDGGWVGDARTSYDTVVKRSRERFLDLVKNTYRVLLSRGLRGCYVYFMDADTERYVRSRIEADVDGATAVAGETAQAGRAAARPAWSTIAGSSGTRASPQTPATTAPRTPFVMLSPDAARPFQNCVPLYELEAAARLFGAEGAAMVRDAPAGDAATWVALPDVFRPSRDLFVARVVGESMNRRIPNGAWCLFRLDPAGSREGKVVLVQHRAIADADTGGHFAVKVYHDEKVADETGACRRARIVLRPDTTAPGHEPIEIDPADADDLRVIAELVAVLG